MRPGGEDGGHPVPADGEDGVTDRVHAAMKHV
jgi:hypothetical protein